MDRVKPAAARRQRQQQAKYLLAEDKEIERYPLAIRAEDVTIVPVEEMFAE